MPPNKGFKGRRPRLRRGRALNPGVGRMNRVLAGAALVWASCSFGAADTTDTKPCETETEGRVAKTGINYLFPPEQINNLPTWRFVLHFKAPSLFPERRTKKASEQLKTASFKAVTFPIGLDSLPYNKEQKVVSVPIEVTEARRRQDGSLGDYESDVWKIYGNMVQCGFGDLYYEAVDWRE